MHQHLERVSRKFLEEHPDVVRKFVGRNAGIYALYRRNRLYYVGLASRLSARLKHHVRDRHGQSWDRFSIYLTIKDQHLREIESLLLPIAKPSGNRVGGKPAGSQNMRRWIERATHEKRKQEVRDLFDRPRHRVPRDVEARVQRVREDARSVLQEALKTESRLVMRTPEETAENLPGAHVPVKVVPGHPAILKAVEFSDNVERTLLIGRYRASLEQARSDLPRLTKLREELSKLSNPRPVRISEADLKSIEEWIGDLLKETRKV